MADTRRTLAALQTLLADNTSGDISAQDIRDFLVSVYGLAFVEGYAAAASASLDFTTGISSLYDEYELRLNGLLTTNNATTLRLRVSTNGGSTWETTNYNYTINYSNTTGGGGSTGVVQLNSQDAINLGGTLSNAGTAGVSGVIRLFNLTSAAKYKVFTMKLAVSHSDGNYYRFDTVGWWLGATAVNALQLSLDSGTLASGSARLYGVGIGN